MLKKSNFPKIVKTTSKKSYVKASEAKPTSKPTSGDKTPGIEPSIHFYAIEDVAKTGEGEEAEIILIHNSSLEASKKNLVKRKFSYINTFNHEGPAVVSAMHKLNIGVFEHLYITSPMYMDQRVANMQSIMRGDSLKKLLIPYFWGPTKGTHFRF